MVRRISSTSTVWPFAIVVLATLTAVVVIVDGPLPGEVALIRWLQSFGQPVPAIAEFTRAITGTEANLLIGVVPAVFAVRAVGRRAWVAVAICLIAMLIVQPVSKELVDRDRPDATQVEVRADHSSRSYPSGHSLSTATVWGLAALVAWRRRRTALAVSLVAPIAITGVASGVQGVHWASDAVAGTIVGAGAAWLAAAQLAPRLGTPGLVPLCDTGAHGD